MHASISQRPTIVSITKGTGQITGNFSTSGNVTRKEGDRKSVEYRLAGILQPVFCGAKEAERNLAFNSGFERTESRYCIGTFQDGDGRTNAANIECGRLGNVNRFQGRVLPYFDSSIIPEVSTNCNREQSVSVQSVTNGSKIFSKSVHEGDRVCQRLPTAESYRSTPILGRLPDSGEKCETSREKYKDSIKISGGFRFCNQPREIRAESYTTDSVFGRQLCTTRGNSTTGRRENYQVQASLRKFLTKTVHTARVWQHVIGLLVAMEKLVPGGRLRIRPLQFELAKQWKQGIQDQNCLVKVTREVSQAVEWWSQLNNVNEGTQLNSSRETVQIFTDASLTGWDGHMGNLLIKRIWNQEEQCLHINVLELKVVLKTVQQFKKYLQHKVVLVATDNTTAVAYIQKQGGTK